MQKEYYQEWKGSIHSRKGITCEYCHGGSPGEPSKERAHKGVYGSFDPRSSVFYNRIPPLCGSCHKAEFNEFKTSSHYDDFITKGVGPNCVTCHDAMSTKVIQADEMEIFCAVCHNETMIWDRESMSEAKKVMLNLEATGKKFQEAEKTLEGARQKGINTEKAAGFLNLARLEYFASRQNWHAFKLDRVSFRLKGVEKLILQSEGALGESVH